MLKCILDIGCNDFTDTIMYLNQGYYVYAIDANPYYINKAKEIIPKCFEGYYTVLNYGIDEINIQGQIFYVNNFSTWSSFNAEKGHMKCPWDNKQGGLQQELLIDCITIESLYEQHIKPKFSEIEYIKIDIECKDHEAMISMNNLKTKPLFLSCELGEVEILNQAKALGYKKFQIVNQAQYKNINRTITTVNGEKIDYQLKLGCSGPFGIDLDKNKWCTFDQICDIIGYLNKNDKNWYDLHCSLK